MSKSSTYKSMSSKMYLIDENVFKYPFLKSLNESRISLTEQETTLLKEFYNLLDEEDIRELNQIISEGWFDRLKAKGTGVGAVLKNFGNYMKNEPVDSLKDPKKSKLDNRINSFKNAFGKQLSDLSNDLSKLNLDNIDDLQAKAKDMGIEKKPNPIIPWVIKTVKKIESKAAKSPIIQNAREVINNLSNDIASRFPEDGAIKKSVRALGNYAKDNPKKVNFAIGGLVALSRLSLVPGAGLATGLLLRTVVGVAKGEEPAKAVYSAAKVAGTGYLVGGALKGAMDFVSDVGPNVADAGVDAADGESPYIDTGVDGEVPGGSEIGSDYVQKTANGFKLSGGIKNLIDNKTDIILKDIEGVESVDQLDPKIKNMLLKGMQDGDSSTSMAIADRKLAISIMGHKADGELGGFKKALNNYMMKGLAGDNDGKFYNSLFHIDDSTYDSIGPEEVPGGGKIYKGVEGGDPDDLTNLPPGKTATLDSDIPPSELRDEALKNLQQVKDRLERGGVSPSEMNRLLAKQNFYKNQVNQFSKMIDK